MPFNTRCLLPVLILAGSIGLHGCERAATQADTLATLTTAERLAELDSIIPALMDSGDVTGMSVAITADTGIVWARGFGVRSQETRELVEANTVFEAASLSKPVFAYAVLQLVDQGVLDLDTPIADYYEYESITRDERYRLITPRMVLTHSPGFPNWRPRLMHGHCWPWGRATPVWPRLRRQKTATDRHRNSELHPQGSPGNRSIKDAHLDWTIVRQNFPNRLGPCPDTDPQRH